MLKRTYLIFIISFLALFVAGPVLATDCPYGLVDDPYPGQCSLYVDENGDGICDLSQEAAADPDEWEEVETTETVESDEPQSGDEEEFQGRGWRRKQEDTAAVEASDNSSVNETEDLAPVNNTSETKASGQQVRAQRTYYFWPILLGTIAVYFVSWLLAKLKFWPLKWHRRVWNVLLLLTFIGSTFFAILWLVGKEYSAIVSVGLDNTFWHVELGLVMIIIGVIHLYWYRRYYFVMFKSKKPKLKPSDD